MIDFVLMWLLISAGAVIVVVIGNLSTVILVWPWVRKYVRKVEVK